MEAVAGKAPERQSVSPISESLQVNLKDENARIIIQAQKMSIFTDSCSDIDVLKKLVSKIVERTSEIGWDTTLRIGIRTIWLEPSNLNFLELVKSLKEKNYVPNAIVNESIDLAISFTLKDGNNQINFISGPVTREEASLKYEIEKNTLPEVALAVDLDYFTLNEMKFSEINVAEFVTLALTYSKEKAELTQQINI